MRLYLKFNAFLFHLILLWYLTPPVTSKGQYVMPVLLGMKMSLPYDAANVFNRPFAAVLSTVLASSLCIILFFGVITSPFGYMFGIPSRKYVLGSETDPLHSQSSAPRSLDNHYTPITQLLSLVPEFPEPEEERNCQKLALCLSHSLLKFVPTPLLQLYSLTSKFGPTLPTEYKSAILQGLQGSTRKCSYIKCPLDPFTLVVQIYMNFLPSEEVRSGNFRKRKQEMYAEDSEFLFELSNL